MSPVFDDRFKFAYAFKVVNPVTVKNELNVALVPPKAPVSVPPVNGKYPLNAEVKANVPVALGNVYVYVPLVIVDPNVNCPVILAAPVTCNLLTVSSVALPKSKLPCK